MRGAGSHEVWGGKVVATMAVALIASSVLFLGKGAWIIGKAHLAQALLAQAWEDTRADGAMAGGTGVKPWPWADTWPVARLTVARLGVDEIVLAGGSGEAMAFGPTMVEDGRQRGAWGGPVQAVLAGGGSTTGSTGDPSKDGNVVLAGHRDTHFRFLRNLEAGDEIALESAGGGTLLYRVEGSEVVDYRDRRPLRPTSEPTLTLVTCYPFDAVAPGGPLRFVVRAVAASEGRSSPPGP